MSAVSFDVIAPVGPETPVVVEIPHAGVAVLAVHLACLAAPARSIARDADLYVDELYTDAPAEGATLVVARTSRYVINLNRSESDLDTDVVEGVSPAGAGSNGRHNHGLIWRLTSEGERVLTRPLARSELEERLDRIYRPYHAAVLAELEKKRKKFGIAVLLAAHSMPSLGRGPFGSVTPRADVVPGTRGRTSAAARFINRVEACSRAMGWTVRHDNPYAGGYSTQRYGKPEEGVHAIQVELARRLYVDEATLRPLGAEMAQARVFCRGLVRSLSAEALSFA